MKFGTPRGERMEDELEQLMQNNELKDGLDMRKI